MNRLLAGSYQLASILVLSVTQASLAAEMPWVVVSADSKGFELEHRQQKFTPWGFNYDHDPTGRLIEDYWETEWDRVERDFHSMKALNANVVRIHLQLGKFLTSSQQPNQAALERLKRLVELAEETGMYLDLTGLGCYHKRDVPAWYDELDEEQRWNAQAVFWKAIAATCASSPAIFCYDLMNEPVVAGGKRDDRDWLGPPFAGKHFVQFITLDAHDRSRSEIAAQWIHRLVTSIRTEDPRHLITVGLVDWSLDRPGLTSGFVPSKVAPELDFLAVHLYPQAGQVEQDLQKLAAFDVGKPIVIEETFPLKCSMPEFGRFIAGARNHAAGLIGFFWGQRPEDLQESREIGDQLTWQWLEFFQLRPWSQK